MTPFLAAAALAAAATVPWTEDIDAAFRTAAERRVPVMVDVWAVWCVPCKRMDDETYRDPRIVEAAGRIVALKVDADAQPIFIERYAVEAYPEVLFLDEGGREIGRLTGFQSAEQLLPVLERAAEGYPLYRAWLEGDADPAAKVAVGEYLAAMGNRRSAAKALEGPARRAGKAPDSMDESLRLRLGLALIAAGEAKDAVPILQEVGRAGSTREARFEALRALAGLDATRATRDAARAAAERLEREYPEP